jgi:hypothetical protein
MRDPGRAALTGDPWRAGRGTRSRRKSAAFDPRGQLFCGLVLHWDFADFRTNELLSYRVIVATRKDHVLAIEAGNPIRRTDTTLAAAAALTLGSATAFAPTAASCR